MLKNDAVARAQSELIALLELLHWEKVVALSRKEEKKNAARRGSDSRI